MSEGAFGFPTHLAAYVSCTRDGGPLRADPANETSGEGRWITRGRLVCTQCAAAYPIDGGILDVFGDARPEGEGAHEQAARDAAARKQDAGAAAWFSKDDSYLEIGPTLEAVDGASAIVLELGAGDGRYTTRLANVATWVVALDFSLESLKLTRARLGKPGVVGLVHGDVTTMRVPAAKFDRVFSTLTSNLPSRAHRDKFYRLAAHALAPSGRSVASTHHLSIRERLARTPQSGHYKGSGIYRYNFTVGECRRELREFFTDAHVRPIQVYLPFVRRLGLPLAAQSRVGERLPVLNRFGELLLFTAGHRPVRAWWSRGWPYLVAAVLALWWAMESDVFAAEPVKRALSVTAPWCIPRTA